MGTEIRRTEWLWVTGVVLGLIILCNLPHVIAWVATPEGSHFTGFVSNPWDQHSYIAKMRQGWNGSWRYHLAYTPERTDGAPVFLFYLLLGHISRLTRIPLIWMYHGVRVLACAVLIPLCYVFSARTFAEVRKRRWTTLLIVISSGLGWLAAPLGAMTPDLWVAEAITFYALFTLPHFPLSMALMLLILMLLGNPKRRMGWSEIIGAAFSSVALGVLQPFAVIPVYAALGMVFALHMWRDRRIPWRWVWLTGIAGIVAVAYPLYGLLVVRADPVMSIWNAQNQTPSPPVWEWLLAFGFVALLAIPGSIWVAQRRNDSDLLLLAWVVVTAVGVYIPLSLQRRLIIGVHIPLCVLAGLGWWQVIRPRLRGRMRNLVQGLVLGMSALTNIFLIAGTIIAALSGETWLYLAEEEYQAFVWLRDATPLDAVVLCAPQTGMFVPAWAGQRVVYGHPFETVDAERRKAQVEAYWAGEMSTTEQESFLRENRVGYVLVGPREQEGGERKERAEQWDELVFETGDVRVYRVGE